MKLDTREQELFESLMENYEEFNPPTKIKDAEYNILLNLIMYIEGAIDEEFNYTAWKEGGQSKFDSARKKIINKLFSMLNKPIVAVVVVTPTESLTDSPFEFEIDEVKKDVKTLEDYLEMKP